MTKPGLLAGVAAMMLASCGGETDAGVEVGGAETTAVAAECGAALPVTGLCSNAVDAQFLKVNPRAPKLATRCVWQTREVSLTPTDAIVFRAQDCTAEGWVPVVYETVQTYVKFRMEGTPSDQAVFILEFLPLATDETAEQAAMKTLAKAPEDQRARCATRPLNGPVLAGTAFELAPNEEFTTELNALYPDEPWEACGPNGVAQGGVQFWEARKSYALFHMLGQDDPPWDPASFTFYRKGNDGVWAKAG